MAYDSSDVAAASPLTTGGILRAPNGTPLPTTATAALDGDFVALGLVGEDGLTPSGEAASIVDLRAWGGETVASVTESSSITRFDFTLLSIFDPDVAEVVYGESNVSVTAATISAGTKLAITEKGEDPVEARYIFDMKHGAKRMRIVVPRGQLVISQELAFADATLSGYQCSLTALPDDSGVRTYRYYENDDVLDGSV